MLWLGIFIFKIKLTCLLFKSAAATNLDHEETQASLETSGSSGDSIELASQGDEALIGDDLNEWEIVKAGKGDKSLVRSEHYVRLPIMRHDLILPYFLIISLMCALIA
jgi:hypothetical protein